MVSSAETIGAFNTGFETVNLHRPTLEKPTGHLTKMTTDAGDEPVMASSNTVL
jgi:hypothetical protein